MTMGKLVDLFLLRRRTSTRINYNVIVITVMLHRQATKANRTLLNEP